MYSYRSEEAGRSGRTRQAEGTEPQFYKTHYKVLQGKLSEQRNIDFGKTQLFVRPHRKEEKKQMKPKLYYHSPNLEEKMTLYLNNLLNRSREERLEPKEPSVPNEEELSPPLLRPSCNTRNLFWQKMKKVVSHRREKVKEDPFLGRAQSFRL